MSLHTWSRVNQHISHKSSGPFQRYKHNITFLTAEVFHKFLFCTRKRQHFIPWQVPNSYTGKIFTGDGQQVNFLNVFFFSSFFCPFLLIQYHGDNSDQTMHLLWFIQYILVLQWNIKQRIHTKHIIKQQSDSSGMTAWLSMADWSSPVPGLSVYYQHKKTHQLLCQDPGGGRCANVVIINMRTGLIITVVLQCMFLIDNSRSDLSDKVVKLHLNFTHASCTGIIYTFVLIFFFWHIWKIIFYGSFKLVLWHFADSSKVLNWKFNEQQI